jgi:exosortase
MDTMAAAHLPEALDDEVRPDPGSLENQARRSVVVRRWLLASGCVLVAFSPWLWRAGLSLWSRPHYQGFPLIVAGFVFLIRQRLPEIIWPAEDRISVRTAILGFAAAGVLGAAAFLNSAWLGLVSCLLALWSLTWFFAGPGATRLRGPFLFLATVLPLPLELDRTLIVSLQKTATNVASQGLEFVEILHTVSGVAIRTVEKSYQVKEACSGIQSLFAAITVIAFCCVNARYSVWRSMLLLVCTGFWVVVANALRVFVIVFGDVRFGLALDTGWMHEALGIATYAFAMALIVSSDQLMRFVFPVLQDQLLDVDLEFEQQVKRPVREFLYGLLDRPGLSRTRARPVQWLAVLFLLLIFGTGLERTLAASRAGRPQIAAWKPAETGPLQHADRVQMPEDLSGFQLLGSGKQVRGLGDPFGLNSWQWQYRRGGISLLVSLDGYYPDWHGLGGCYEAIGWELESSGNVVARSMESPAGPAEADSRDPVIPHTEHLMRRNSLAFGLLTYTCFDAQLSPVMPHEVHQDVSGALRQRLKSSRHRGAATAIEPPVFQVQMLVETDRRLTPRERDELVAVFQVARAELIRQLGGPVGEAKP